MALTKNLQNLLPESNMSYKTKVMVKEVKLMNKINLKKSHQIKSLELFRYIHSCNRRYNSCRW